MLVVRAKVDEKKARKVFESLRKGLIRREKIEGIKLVWLPCAIIRVRMFEQEKFADRQLNVSEIINVYDLVQGVWTGMSFSYFPEFEELDDAERDDVKLSEDLKKGVKIDRKYEVEDVIRRLKSLNSIVAFAGYGLSANAVGVEVEEAREAYYPIYVGKITGKSGSRYVAISGVSGNPTAIGQDFARLLWES